MSGRRLDAALARWADAWASGDAAAVVALYRIDASLIWYPHMDHVQWGAAGIGEKFEGWLAGGHPTAEFAPSIGPDDGMAVAEFRTAWGDTVYEGIGFFLLGAHDRLEVDRRYPA